VAHTSGRVSILIGTLLLYALAKLYATSTKVTVSRTKNPKLVAIDFGKRCTVLIKRDLSPTTHES
jgi:hypothetical protein